MKPFFRIFKLFSAAIIVFSVILFMTSLLLQDKVSEIVINKLNKNNRTSRAKQDSESHHAPHTHILQADTAGRKIGLMRNRVILSGGC